MNPFDSLNGYQIIFRFTLSGQIRDKPDAVNAIELPIINTDLTANKLPITTAAIFPEKFSGELFFASNARVTAIILAVFMLIGFGLRVTNLGAESLGEDELNKLQTVAEYRENGLSGKNGEHPFLMKGLQTLSVSAAETLNSSANLNISDEAAIRFPIALFGSFTALLIFLLVAELFGVGIGLVSAVLWCIEPVAIGFDRIAKEDSLVLFFFLLTNLFWIRGQTAAELGKKNWTRYAWATAAGFAALMASKYYPHLLAVIGAYYIIFQYIPATRWRMEPSRWLKFLVVMGVSFLILNPTIVLPDTWREMLKFSTENRIGHDSYEFLGGLYTNKMSAWLNGVPWTFYYVFIAVKTSLATLIMFVIGLPLIFKRKMGDGRFFIFFWAFMWFMPFTFLGGKFTRYFTLVEPMILIIAAVGFCLALKWLTERWRMAGAGRAAFQSVLLLVFITFPLLNALAVRPHFRMFTNSVGGGTRSAGEYFPHDEFYDSATKDIVAGILPIAPPQTTIACETPTLFDYYAAKAGRNDLTFVSLSDKAEVAGLKVGDVIVIASGRRYFSNAEYVSYLTSSASPAFEIKILDSTAALVYQLNERSLADIRKLAE